MYAKIIIDKTALPSPTKVNVTREILWSSSTGRSVKTGEMIGAVVATKRTMEVEWTNITASEYETIRNALYAGFFGPVYYNTSDGGEIIKMTKAYRSNFTEDDKGFVKTPSGYTHYYTSVKVSIIEK